MRTLLWAQRANGVGSRCVHAILDASKIATSQRTLHRIDSHTENKSSASRLENSTGNNQGLLYTADVANKSSSLFDVKDSRYKPEYG